jgi:ATP-binding cassette subfamily F protein uup
MEAEVEQLHAKMSDPDFYRKAGEQVASTMARLDMVEKELTAAYVRWEELDSFND